MTNLESGELLSDHPTSEEIAAYLSDSLTPASRAVLEEHLAGCRDCRQDVASARRLLRQYESAKRRRWLVPVAAAAAAVLAVVVLARAPGRTPIGEEALRSGRDSAGSEASIISVLTPADGDTLSAGQVIFAWRPHPGKPLYRLTLTDPSGRAIWTGETADTTVTTPAAVAVEPGRTYFWTIDALGADGRSLTTGTHRFSIRP